MLRLVRADDYLQGRYGVSEEVAMKIVKDTYEVMQYENMDELIGAIRGLSDKTVHYLVGKWGEWRLIQMAHEYGILVDDYQIRVEEETIKILDVILKRHPFEVKYWDWESWTEEEKVSRVNELLDALENGYKEAYENPSYPCYHEKAFLAFLKELPQDGLDYIANKLREKFGNFENWLEILNGDSKVRESLKRLG